MEIKDCINVTLKKNEVIIKIDVTADHKKVMANLKKKIPELKKLYKEEKTPILIKGKILSTKEKKEIKTLIQDAKDAEYIYGRDLNTGALFYFSADEEKDGSMKTGSTVKISLNDDDYTFKFKKTSGEAVHGVDNHKLYDHGILQDAGDDTYALVELHDADGSANTSATFLVNKECMYSKIKPWICLYLISK